MNYRMIYLLLAIVGCLVPYVLALEFVSESGFSAGTFLDAIAANGLTTGFAVDVVIASVAFWVAAFELYRRGDGPVPWVFMLLTPIAGLGFALPLYLFVRHVSRDRQAV